jgi:putative ABC transport system permease protein
VLGFAAVLAMGATVSFGLWPAIRASRLDLVHSLKGKTVGLVNTRLVGRLVVAEIAMAFVLLTASSLLVRSLLATQSIDPGFRTERLISIAIRLSESKYPDVEDRFDFHRRLREEVEALPGVLCATPSLFRPGGGTRGISGAMRFEGQSEEEARKNAMAQLEWVAPNFFQVMGIPIVRGRAFTDTDREGSEPVAIINESIARARWPGEDPIGKWAEGFSRRYRIVGVAADTRFRELRHPWQSIYFSVEQNPFRGRATGSTFLVPKYLVVQTAGDPEVALRSILDRIRGLDKEIPLDDVTTFDALMDRELARPRFHAFVSSVFSVVGLVLAVTGIYGVIASFVAQRLPELGLRMALGATPERLRGWIVVRGLQMSVLGLAFGLILAVPSLRFAESLLYGISPSDLASFVAVAFILAVVSLTAVYIPARGASRADPLTLLREE